MLQFRGSLVTSDAWLLAHRELDDVLGLSEMVGNVLADARRDKNGRHALAGLFRQSVFGRLRPAERVVAFYNKRGTSNGSRRAKARSKIDTPMVYSSDIFGSNAPQNQARFVR
jgi:hypothetical protein